MDSPQLDEPKISPMIDGGSFNTSKKQFSLQVSLGITLSILILLVSLLLAGLLEGFARREILRLAQQHLETVGQQMARELSSGINEFSREVQTQANADILRQPNATPAEMRDVMNKFVALHPEFMFLGVVDAGTHKVLASNGGLFEGGSAKDRPAYENAKKAPFLGDVHEAVRLAELLPKPVNGDPLRFLDASAPITDKSGQVIRVLAGHISSQWTDQVRKLVLSPLNEAQHIEILLVDTAGKIVLSPNDAVRIGTPVSSLAKNISMSSATVQQWSDGKDYLSKAAPVMPRGAFDGFGWKVIVRQPAEVAFASATILRNAFFAGALLLGSIAAWLAWIVSGRITRPVRELAEAAERISPNSSIGPEPKTPIGEVTLMHRALSRLANEGQHFARSSMEQQEQFVTLSDCLPHLVFQTDSDGAIEFVNQQWRDVFGSAEGLSLNDLSSIIHADDELMLANLWKRSKEDSIGLVATVRMAATGSTDYQWFKVRSKPVLNATGKITRWVGTLTNIHQVIMDAERLEAALDSERKARSEVERVSRMKDEFLATLSHELRTPLSVINGWAQMMESRSGADEFVTRAGNVIRRNVEIQAKLISDLLDMSAVVAGKIMLDTKMINGVQLVEGLLQSMSKVAQEKGVVLSSSLPAAEVKLIADPIRLSQIITNLLSNAIKFTESGGTVRVSGSVTNKRFMLQVADSGCGIAAEFLPYVFDRFRQEDGSSTRKRGGIGLGLAIAKSLVELHEGMIRAESDGPGKGCTITIMLPLMPSNFLDAVEPVGSDGAAASKHFRINGAKVLLIDDDDDARDMAKELLQRFGATVDTAASAPEGLKQLKAKPHDVLICDISMPEMDGYACMRAVRAITDPQLARTPAIALTAFAMKQDQIAAMEAGFDAHLAKPFAANDLLTAIEKVLLGRSVIDNSKSAASV